MHAAARTGAAGLPPLPPKLKMLVGTPAPPLPPLPPLPRYCCRGYRFSATGRGAPGHVHTAA